MKTTEVRSVCAIHVNLYSGEVLGSIPAVGGRGSSVVERATPVEEVRGSIPAVAASSLLVGSVSV